MLVRRHTIIGTNIHIYRVWAPRNGHGTITTINGAWMGRVGTEALPAALDALPYGAERCAAVRAWQQAQYDAAYAAILAAHPEAAAGRRDMGEIEVVG
jgi:hypothetical protein